MKIILISGFYSDDDPEIVEAIRSRRAQSFLAKPFQIDAIRGAVAASGPKLDRRFCCWSAPASPGVVAC
jgi:ActR/RegA family two-component response regulator